MGNHRDGKHLFDFHVMLILINSISSLGKVKSTYAVFTTLKLSRLWEPRILRVERLLSMRLFVGWDICSERVGAH